MKPTPLDRVKGSLGAFVARTTSRVDYHALYPSAVVSQSGQRVDLQPDSTQVPPMSRVPLRLGLPGVEVTVAPGSRVLLGFENGDPSRPVATLWEKSSLLALTIEAGTGVTVKAPAATVEASGSATVKAPAVTIDHAASLELGTPSLQHVARGEALNTAISALGTAIAAALTGMATAAVPTGTGPLLGAGATAAAAAVTAAVTAFTTAATAALSPTVRVK